MGDSMTAEELLQEINCLGFKIKAEGGVLMVSPAGRLPTATRMAIHPRREQLLRLLESSGDEDGVRMAGHPRPSPPGRCPHCNRDLDSKRRCWPCCDRLCSACGRLTGTAFVELCIVCGQAEP